MCVRNPRKDEDVFKKVFHHGDSNSVRGRHHDGDQGLDRKGPSLNDTVLEEVDPPNAMHRDGQVTELGL